FGRLSRLVEHRHFHCGTSMPFREGATIPLVWATSGHRAMVDNTLVKTYFESAMQGFCL
ncbi:hypothetical protein SAMN04515617_1553, partial [Collimonas sp. OK242]